MRNNYSFPAVIYHDTDGISIEFPDLPGCLPCAKSDEEAVKNAIEALGLHLLGMERGGDEIPTPTPAENIKVEKNANLIIVNVYMPPIRVSAKTFEKTKAT